MIVVSGCSFTADCHSWAYNLNGSVDNLARPGMGNEYIIGSVIRRMADLSLPGAQAVIVQLSNYWRTEILSGPWDPTWERARRSRASWAMVEDHYSIPESELIVLRTTDRDHRWWAKLPGAKIIDGVERTISSDQRLIRTYEAIHRLLLYVDSVGIPCRIFWGWQSCIAPPNNPALVDPVIQMIDWDRIDSQPMAEWCLANGYAGKLEEDHINTPPRGWTDVNGVREMVGHPSPEAQSAYAQKVIQPWLNSIL